MLQQTQVDRVVPKYREFLRKFPTVAALARAPQSEVLKMWQGLGYNRRALFLKRTAEIVINDFAGELPKDRAALETLPGIGSYTAGALLVFAFQKLELFIETNIRRALIHHFFPKRKSVKDAVLIELLRKIIDRKNPRAFYYALMDYGATLGRKVSNPNRRSAHYTKQSRFEGSHRQIRGKILRLLTRKNKIAIGEMKKIIGRDATLTHRALRELQKEGFIEFQRQIVQLI